MPNVIASIALLVWPLVTLALFRRLRPGTALVASLLAGYLLLPPLPAEFDPPLLPSLNKSTIPSLSVLFVALALRRLGPGDLVPRHPLMQAALAAFVLSPLMTVLRNDDPLAFGPLILPALRVIEIPGLLIQQWLLAVPFLMARAFLRDEAEHRLLLWALVAGGLAYTLPILIEVRLSPQLNTWIYGYFQHSFSQMVRGDGFRPIVFLYHGLWVAFFVAMTVLAALGLAREARGRRAVGLWIAGAGLMVVLVLAKSLAPLLYVLLLAPAILLAPRRVQLLGAAAMAALSLGYPLLKGADLVPQERLLEWAGDISADRAQSLGFRFDNEDVLLERAMERPVFGWGIWGRNLLYDRESGREITVTDGRWLVVIGVFGWVGFLAEFGLLAFPVLRLWIGAGRAPPGAATVTLAVILGMNLVDLLPNATLTPLTFLAAGAILGRVEAALAQARARAAPPPLRTVL
ncbi:hypothetical protein [Limimaricola hongkongensis]|uniref:Uncharacterized protein n=1 Tax=Limimaricola hongkongensis DSM 17492 TaxID=1122180 RepID=A0A017HD84_9RHOB|nr:hypothetical protein [Limimaricola hongkongensis]EYD72078.1 hypothetical protein Lokhon_02150 [Limimaricola hongkongensis DSM 17492]